MLIVTLFLVFVSFAFAKTSLTEVDTLRYNLIELEQKLWSTIINEHTNSITSQASPEVSLLKSYKSFGDDLEKQIPQDFTQGLDSLENVWIWARTYGELRSIYALYESFRRFQKLQVDKGRVPSPKQAWLDLAETILHDGKSSVPDAFKNIDDFVKTEKLFQEALKEIIFKPCEINNSPSQILYSLYNSIAITELKGYLMMQFAAQLLKLYNANGNYIEEAQLMRHRYHEQSITIAEAVKSAMNQTNTEVWKCDPKKHVEGETYTELTRLLQAYIENEIDLSPTGSCFKNCAYYDYAKNNGCYKNGFCSKQPRCKGKILNCEYIDSDMWVCPSDRSSSRRYDYIEYENGRILGRKLGCDQQVTKVDSWWRYLFWHCSYCICLCDDESNSDRYFNLREYVSDMQNNMVVTGLRFKKKNNVIHLQIQEGKLLPFGKINETTIQWKPLDGYKITDRTVKEGTDYHMLTYYKRDMDLDDLILDSKYLITGVRFRMLGTHLNFEIQATPFNFSTGQLIQPMQKSFWHSSDNTPLARKRLYLQVPDLPIRSYLPSIPDSENDEYVVFTNSDFDRDAGQSTVPFIDTQDVVLQTPAPLSGAGIYHKGRPYFGGFVAPKLFTFKFDQHINVLFPPEIKTDEIDIVDVNTN